ncbi:MAG: DUF4974 domain-containing protein [Bacteroidales bacterium]|jgi:ferric-dicitrate binding protein FerR (iron transport regulator)|nr:DUF4974 domain-containing protein [Bacteroidales bacterium]
MTIRSIKDLDFLIGRYLEDKCTGEEKNKLIELLGSVKDERSSKEELLSQLNDFQEAGENISRVDFERIYTELMNEINHRDEQEKEKENENRRIRVRRLVIQAVSAAAIICFGFFLGTVFSPAGKVTVTEQPVSAAYIEVKAPLGARSEVRLNDGTEVLLNAGSMIKYRSDYNLNNRDLTLEGEAYFRVASNTDLPLVVNAGNINIKATGTEFNVKAYSEEGIIETTLVDGEVEISHKGNSDKDKVLILKPNQKAIYAEQSDLLTLEKIKEIEPQAVKIQKIETADLLVSPETDVEQATAWTQNKLIIRSENLESLCTKLQRKYNVTFVFSSSEIKKHRFSGVLLDETLQQVLDVITLTAPVDYLLDKKTVLLFPSKEQPE